ncbi:hypothetical protein [Microbacterium marmarense]|uniref:DUF3137 domain-containing protein n=1 Tax=Microbacterium marmarense TaxID=3122051 RepID=A0ABU8LQS1_9MICO
MSAAAPPHYPFYTAPLTEPVDGNAARTFEKHLRASDRLPKKSSQTVMFVVVGVVFAFMLFPMFGGALIALGGSTDPFAAFVETITLLAPILFIGIAATVVIVIFVRRGPAGAVRMYRLDRFARANAMTYEPHLANPGLPGMIFTQGSARASSDLVRGDQPRFVEFANYRYTTGSGKNRTTHQWGYVAVKLDVPLPHIVLDALGNNALFGSNLPTSFAKDQRLSLEGDFDRYFSLYCPSGYERDALYLFTPDIMARFIDNAAALDVEIVDDWLFLYAKRDFSTLDAATWAWLFSVVGALLDKLAQWARWRDDRLRMDAAAAAALTATAAHDAASMNTGAAHDDVPFAPPLDTLRPPPGVAAPGKRLTRRGPWIVFAIAGGFVLLWFVQMIAGGFFLLQ